jgi:hypothetical protein
VVIRLFRYNRFLRDDRVDRAILERTLAYNVVTKEYKVTPGPNERRPPATTRELRDATRILSEVRGVKLTPATSLDPTRIYYVRINAETAINGDSSFVARMSGLAERAERRSDFRTVVPTR